MSLQCMTIITQGPFGGFGPIHILCRSHICHIRHRDIFWNTIGWVFENINYACSSSLINLVSVDTKPLGSIHQFHQGKKLWYWDGRCSPNSGAPPFSPTRKWLDVPLTYYDYWNQCFGIYKVGMFLGRSEVSPRKGKFSKRYPEKRLDVPLRYHDFLNQRINIYKEGISLVRAEVSPKILEIF